MAKEFPKELIDTFVACKKSGWDDTKIYVLYREEAKKFLKGKFEETLEQGRLVVDLARATMDLFNGDSGVKEKTKKAKATKKLVSRPRKVPQLGGSDGKQAEEKGTQEVAVESKG